MCVVWINIYIYTYTQHISSCRRNWSATIILMIWDYLQVSQPFFPQSLPYLVPPWPGFGLGVPHPFINWWTQETILSARANAKAQPIAAEIAEGPRCGSGRRCQIGPASFPWRGRPWKHVPWKKNNSLTWLSWLATGRYENICNLQYYMPCIVLVWYNKLAKENCGDTRLQMDVLMVDFSQEATVGICISFKRLSVKTLVPLVTSKQLAHGCLFHIPLNMVYNNISYIV